MMLASSIYYYMVHALEELLQIHHPYHMIPPHLLHMVMIFGPLAYIHFLIHFWILETHYVMYHVTMFPFHDLMAAQLACGILHSCHAFCMIIKWALKFYFSYFGFKYLE